MFCMECGSPINADAKFCDKCGAAVLLNDEPKTNSETAPKKWASIDNTGKTAFAKRMTKKSILLTLVGISIVCTVSYVAIRNNRQTLLQSLLSNKWTMKVGMPCSLNGGAYSVFDKEYGRYYVIRGVAQKTPKKPIVTIEETNSDSVSIDIALYGTAELERMLNESNVIAGYQKISLRRLDNGRVEERVAIIQLDFDALLRGRKSFKTGDPSVSIIEACSAQSAQ